MSSQRRPPSIPDGHLLLRSLIHPDRIEAVVDVRDMATEVLEADTIRRQAVQWLNNQTPVSILRGDGSWVQGMVTMVHEPPSTTATVAWLHPTKAGRHQSKAVDLADLIIWQQQSPGGKA